MNGMPESGSGEHRDREAGAPGTLAICWVLGVVGLYLAVHVLGLRLVP